MNGFEKISNPRSQLSSQANLRKSAIRNSTLVDIVLWLLRQRQRFRVEGDSMRPLVQPEEEVLVNLRAYRRSRPSIDDIVIIRSPIHPDRRLIKRVIATRDNGLCFVQGDNPAYSTDSRSFGWIEPELLLGRVTSRFF